MHDLRKENQRSETGRLELKKSTEEFTIHFYEATDSQKVVFGKAEGRGENSQHACVERQHA